MHIVNPATEEIIKEVNEDNKESCAKKFKALQAAQCLWKNFSLEERIKILSSFQNLLFQNIEALAAILTSEVGKPLQQSRNEINGACARIKWLLENAPKYLSDEWMKDEEEMKERISYEPLGVICNISAWNYPYLVSMNVLVPALISGNGVFYKPSEFATLTGLEIVRSTTQP